MNRVLVFTATAAERDAVLSALDGEASAADTAVQVVAGGVGPAASAAATATELTRGRFDLVLCAGIGGGFPPAPVGSVAVASASVFADLGAESGDGFVPLSELGFGSAMYRVGPALAGEIAERTGGHLGTILTVSTVTGTAETAAALRARHPDAVAEAMEGAGVAAAAALHGVAFAEVRAISNPVGPRSRETWRVSDSLTVLGRALAAVLAVPLELG